MKFNNETDSFAEYFERISQRCCESAAEPARCCIWRLIRSADRHFDRFVLAARRYERALKRQDRHMMQAERDIMHALLYETADTVYIVLQILDPDLFEVRPSLDGSGLSGEDAMFIDETLNRLERISKKVMHHAAEFQLQLDFKRPVDEIEGVTYIQHCHWRDFVPGSCEASFYGYFAEVQRGISHRLTQAVRFWHKRSVQQLWLKPKRPAMVAVVRALLTASLAQPRRPRIEKEHIDYVRRHFPPFAAYRKEEPMHDESV